MKSSSTSADNPAVKARPLREKLANFAENLGQLLLANSAQFLDDERRVNRKDLRQFDDGHFRQDAIDTIALFDRDRVLVGELLCDCGHD